MSKQTKPLLDPHREPHTDGLNNSRSAELLGSWAQGWQRRGSPAHLAMQAVLDLAREDAFTYLIKTPTRAALLLWDCPAYPRCPDKTEQTLYIAMLQPGSFLADPEDRQGCLVLVGTPHCGYGVHLTRGGLTEIARSPVVGLALHADQLVAWLVRLQQAAVAYTTTPARSSEDPDQEHRAAVYCALITHNPKPKQRFELAGELPPPYISPQIAQEVIKAHQEHYSRDHLLPAQPEVVADTFADALRYTVEVGLTTKER